MVVAYCSFCPKMPQKASKRGLLAQKSGGLLEFQSSGGLIKSGLLFARIRYFYLDYPDIWTLLWDILRESIPPASYDMIYNIEPLCFWYSWRAELQIFLQQFLGMDLSWWKTLLEKQMNKVIKTSTNLQYIYRICAFCSDITRAQFIRSTFQLV